MLTRVDGLVADRRIVICAGSGGVGKTTTAAAIAFGLAARGARVAVVTIDPARRLADALGLERLGNEPVLVDLDVAGELWALMLDPKRTFDALIERLAPDERTREEVLANRIYQGLSGAVAGSQEFSAIAKLYELDQDGRFDVLVLDTPPSRHALDFLDAPARLAGFFGGRAVRLFARPAGLGGRILGQGTGVVLAALERVTGVERMHDLSVFFRALGGMVDGFVERARRVGALLEDPATTFLIVTAPRHDPMQEAIHLHGRLREAGMPFGGLIVNRVHAPVPEPVAVGAGPAQEFGPSLTGRVEASARALAALAARDARAVARLRERLGDPPTVVVEASDDDVHDAPGLDRVAARLFSGRRPSPRP